MRPTSAKALLLPCVAISAILACGCGSRQEEQPEQHARSETMPREQVLYRQARETLMFWLQNFGRQDRLADLYPVLSSSTLSSLRASGVTNAAGFAAWFNANQGRAKTPFFFKFSDIDMLDVDIRDSNRAVITANFRVELPGGTSESVGSFFLLRERDSWKVPFGAGEEWTKSWWQQERAFSGKLRDRDLAHMISTSLALEVQYPVTWDASDKRQFRAPGTTAPQTGLELAYINPSTQENEVVVRIWTTALMEDESVPDSSANLEGLVLEHTTPAGLSDPVPLQGMHYVLSDRRRHRNIHVFGAVHENLGSFSAYQSTIRAVVESITSTP